MKKLGTIFFASLISFSLTANWTPASKEQAERNAILLQVAAVKEMFASMGANSLSSPAIHGEIFRLLQSIGTPMSYKILQEMVASRELPQHYLNAA
jgi:hypothetical protein